MAGRIKRTERFKHLYDDAEEPLPMAPNAPNDLNERSLAPESLPRRLREENRETGRKVMDAPSVRRQMMNSFTGMVQPRPRAVLKLEVLKGK